VVSVTHVPLLPQPIVAEQVEEQKPGTFCVLLASAAHSLLVQLVGALHTDPSAPAEGPPLDLLLELHAVSARSARATMRPRSWTSTRSRFTTEPGRISVMVRPPRAADTRSHGA
jgi:hypothetical protein